MKEIPNEQSESSKPISRRTLLKSGVATGLLGTGFFAVGETLSHLSEIDTRLEEAQNDDESQVVLAGGWTREELLKREKAAVDSYKIFGLVLTVGGAVQVFNAALNGDRPIE